MSVWVVLYAISAVLSVGYGLLFEEDLNPALAFAALLSLLSLGHWLTIRWIDRNGSWPR